MSRYVQKEFAGLERQLLLSPEHARRRHADRVEALLSSLDADKEYALEFLHYRVTGFRP